ncbi:aldo-keto reductase AKR2E4-like [Achroia grisella]|uniref:aldo-keto reductase AKR2E4-like n=1 Tax=Achroia grisella TaxID=688607 RepID=UPI0027D32636|nr:aldo-keto reductase AKR2E4-like [Achroia grisella]
MSVDARVLFLLICTQMATAVDVPKLLLNNRREIPAIALGTFLGFDQNGVVKSIDKQLCNVVLNAIDLGYRHFDTASVYNTEEEIGEATQKKIAEGAVTRDELFLTTKLWNTHHERYQVLQALKESLKKLGTNYVDLYLMHWPMGLNDDYSYSDVDFMETWRGMEDAVRLGLAKTIGLSNFNKEQVKRVISEADMKPAVLQIEINPQIIQTDLVSYAQAEGLVVMGYSPFGSLVKRFGMDLPGPKMDDPVLVEIAQKYGKTTPQVVLRWMVDKKIIPIPKTINIKRLKENIEVFDFKLQENEIQQINGFDRRVRFTLPSFWQNHPYYPFEKIENPIPDPFAKKS